MNIIDRSAVDALRRQDEERRAREERMRNALEILADRPFPANLPTNHLPSFVRRVAREGLGRETE